MFFAIAQLGTKTGTGVPNTAASGQANYMPLLQTLMVLGILYVVLKWAVPKFAAKYGGRIKTDLNGGIKLAETASCGSAVLQVVEVRGKALLLATSPSGVQFLTDLSNPEKPVEQAPAFFEQLDKAKELEEEELEARAVVELTDEPKPAVDPLAAYERLARITGAQ